MRRWLSRTLLMSLFVALAAGNVARAVEPYEQFLEALLRNGYGEQALDYIDKIQARKDVPVTLRSRLDWERSKAMRIAAGEAYDATQRQARLKSANELLDKFIENNPGHPEVPFAMLSGADEDMAACEQQLVAARGQADEKAKQAAFAAVRKSLKETREEYAAAVTNLRTRLDGLPARPPGDTRQDAVAINRSNTEAAWLEARFKSAFCDFLSVQTWSEAEGDAKERKQLLTNAAQVFDGIFQDYRGRRVAVLAHMWHGRVAEQLGKTELALDIYDETLAGEPEAKSSTEDDARIFGQANLFRFQLAAKTMSPLDAIKEADEWLLAHKAWEKSVPFQGLSLESAKLKAAQLSKTSNKLERSKAIREVTTQLAAIGKVDSEFRREALLLRQKLLAECNADAGEMTAEMLIALGDEAVVNKEWKRATESYEQALAKAATAKPPLDAARQKTVADRLSKSRYQLAVVAYSGGQWQEALALAGKVVGDGESSATAQEAAEVAVAAGVQNMLSSKAEEQPAARERLERITTFVMKTWPDKPVGDDARMALAQIKIATQKPDEALPILKTVNPQSRRYATALQTSALIGWSKYVAAKKDKQPETETVPLRAAVIEQLTNSIAQQKLAWQADSEPMPKSLFEAQLMLAEIRNEGGELELAAPLYAPLIEDLKRTKPKLKSQYLRVLIGAARARVNQKQFADACDVVRLAAQLSDDSAQANAVVIDLLKLVNKELQSASSDDNQQEFQKTASEILAILSPRKELVVPQLIYLGDTATKLEQVEQSREFYLRVIAGLESQPEGGKADDANITRVRARLVGLLRSEGILEEALRQADELIKSHPNALEPLLEKGRILQSLAEKSPERYSECVEHWTKVRLLLSKVQPRPGEYYEAVYNVAASLVEQGSATNESEKNQQGVQLLRSTKALAPELSGSEMVTKFDKLLAKVDEQLAPAKPKATKKAAATKKGK